MKLPPRCSGAAGPGWSRMAKNSQITTTPNQDSPISKPEEKEIPIVGIDVWEHAYYLKYQNRRRRIRESILERDQLGLCC